jgi:hypothetical protein
MVSSEVGGVSMSTWNYGVVKKNGYLGIHEAYYDDTGNIDSLSVEPVSPVYEDLDELKTNLELMADALVKSIIDFARIDSDS